MTPGARVAAAIEILDQIAGGAPAEQTLTRWARGNRFAGSKDRASIRDHVFDVLRCWRSTAHLGGGESGRARMIGKLRRDALDPGSLFTGQGHAPSPLSDDEMTHPEGTMSRGQTWDLPDWLLPRIEDSLGTEGAAEFAALSQGRAPITLRVNLARMDRASALDALRDAGIEARENPLSPSALTVTEGQRKLRNSPLYAEGLVEFQDASSQAVVDTLPDASRMLDYCAGGGGKALAIAARGRAAVFAHDIDPGRMSDLPARADRAGAEIAIVEPGALEAEAPFDTVLVDAPCSGSGAWRRAPEGKWRLTPERLTELTEIQADVLASAAALVAPGGTLAYATCSVLKCENETRIAAFLAEGQDWTHAYEKRLPVSELGDGFYISHLTRTS